MASPKWSTSFNLMHFFILWPFTLLVFLQKVSVHVSHHTVAQGGDCSWHICFSFVFCEPVACHCVFVVTANMVAVDRWIGAPGAPCLMTPALDKLGYICCRMTHA